MQANADDGGKRSTSPLCYMCVRVLLFSCQCYLRATPFPACVPPPCLFLVGSVTRNPRHCRQPRLDSVRSGHQDGATGRRRGLARHEGRALVRPSVDKEQGSGRRLATGEGSLFFFFLLLFPCFCVFIACRYHAVRCWDEVLGCHCFWLELSLWSFFVCVFFIVGGFST